MPRRAAPALLRAQQFAHLQVLARLAPVQEPEVGRAQVQRPEQKISCPVAARCAARWQAGEGCAL